MSDSVRRFLKPTHDILLRRVAGTPRKSRETPNPAHLRTTEPRNVLQALYDLLYPLIIAPELLGRTPFFALENAVEVRNVVETALKTDLGNRLGRIDQHTHRMTQTDLDQIIREIFPRPLGEKTAECRGTHPYKLGQLCKTYLLIIIAVDIGIDLLHAAAVRRIADAGERTARQGARFAQ